MKWSFAILLVVAASSDFRQQQVTIANKAAVDVPHWLDPATQTGLLLERAPLGAVEHGTLLLLVPAEIGPGAASHVTNLRRGFAAFGWRSYFGRVPANPDGAEVAELLLGFRRMLSAPRERIVVIAQGPIAATAARRVDELDAAALVLINLPVEQLDPKLMGDLELPTLLLQEHPHGWPADLPLGADVELHLLSRVDVRRSDSRLQRKIRGWFKRRQLTG